MANLSRTTRDHEEIRRWAEERGGKPSHVKTTGSGEDIGILRIDFPGYSGQGSLEPIGWEQWFEKFDERNLALLYQEETAGGQRSNFNKIVSSETAAENESGRSRSRARKSRKAAKTPKKASKKVAARSAGTKKKAAKSSPRGAAHKRSGAKKAAARKTSTKKTSAKKTSAKRASAKKTSTKKRRR
jgi:hypothetical protein